MLLLILFVRIDFSRAISHQCRSLKCEMRREVHIEQNISKFVCSENYQPVRRQTHYRNYSDFFSKIKNNPIKYRSESYHR
jgi:hypothetical protein